MNMAQIYVPKIQEVAFDWRTPLFFAEQVRPPLVQTDHFSVWIGTPQQPISTRCLFSPISAAHDESNLLQKHIEPLRRFCILLPPISVLR